jgi:hypothetical protein
MSFATCKCHRSRSGDRRTPFPPGTLNRPRTAARTSSACQATVKRLEVDRPVRGHPRRQGIRYSGCTRCRRAPRICKCRGIQTQNSPERAPGLTDSRRGCPHSRPMRHPPCCIRRLPLPRRNCVTLYRRARLPGKVMESRPRPMFPRPRLVLPRWSPEQRKHRSRAARKPVTFWQSEKSSAKFVSSSLDGGKHLCLIPVSSL